MTFFDGNRDCGPFFLKIAIMVVAAFYNFQESHADSFVTTSSDQALYEILNLRTSTAQQILDDEKAKGSYSLFHEYLENWKARIFGITSEK